jgi:anti-sigma B factor antagonist
MTASEPFRVTTAVDKNDCLRLAVHGEVDLWTARETERRLATERDGHPCLVIDLSDVTFMGAAGATLLVRAKLQASTEGRRMTVVDGLDAHRVLEVTGLLRMLDVVEAPLN